HAALGPEDGVGAQRAVHVVQPAGGDEGGGGGGGGGASYTGGVINGITNAGIWLGDGQVIVSWNDPTPLATNITGASMTMCANGQDTLSFSTPSDPNSDFYTWTVDAGLNFLSGQNSNMITVTSMAAGTFTITVVGVNSSCSLSGASSTIAVTVNALPSVSLSANPSALCVSGTSTLSAADTSNTYVWNPGNQTGTSVSVSLAGSTTYTAVATNANGCVDSSTVMVTVNLAPVVTLGSFSTVCLADDSMALTSGNPAGGIYSGTGVTGNTFSPSAAGIGTHTITYTYTDINGCVNSDSASINVDACLGISNAVAAGSIAISPNPATDVVTIAWNANATVTAIKIMDAAGRVVMTETAINGNTKLLDVSALPAGTYTVSTEGSVKTVQTFVKQ
ncbi:MAG TPA: T9SS type A sorting domain-containing protein, partial [Bacteroidia bacterium]|nr:T9SS type A sorting domain-containing protein [Bacteroidia bacterium]